MLRAKVTQVSDRARILCPCNSAAQDRLPDNLCQPFGRSPAHRLSPKKHPGAVIACFLTLWLADRQN